MFTVLSANKEWDKMTIYVDGEGWWYHSGAWFKVYPRIKMPKSDSRIWKRLMKAALRDGPMKEVREAMEY